jgi:hypothetical protein
LKLALRWGSVIVVSIALYIAAKNLSGKTIPPYVDVLVFNSISAAALTLGIRARREQKGSLTVGDGMKTGLAISLVYALGACAFFGILFWGFGPSILAGEQNPKNMPVKAALIGAFLGLFIGAMIGGAILSAVISAILRKKPEGTAPE